jgi:hypothetical protein
MRCADGHSKQQLCSQCGTFSSAAHLAAQAGSRVAHWRRHVHIRCCSHSCMMQVQPPAGAPYISWEKYVTCESAGVHLHT